MQHRRLQFGIILGWACCKFYIVSVCVCVYVDLRPVLNLVQQRRLRVCVLLCLLFVCVYCCVYMLTCDLFLPYSATTTTQYGHSAAES